MSIRHAVALTTDLIEEAGFSPEVTSEMLRLEDGIQQAVDSAVETILWSTTADVKVLDDGTVVPADEDADASWSSLNFSAADVSFTSITSVTAEVIYFVGSNLSDILAYVDSPIPGDAAWSRLGHDLVLTRGRHGAGFRDRGLGDLGDRLTDACHAYGDFDVSYDIDAGEICIF